MTLHILTASTYSQGSSAPWTNPSNATGAADGVYASATGAAAAADPTHALMMSGWGTVGTGKPRQVKYRIKGYVGNTAATAHCCVYDGTSYSATVTFALTTSNGYTQWVDITNLYSSLTWSAISSCVLHCWIVDANSKYVGYVDHGQIEVMDDDGTGVVVSPSACSCYTPLTIDGTQIAESGNYAVLFTGSGNIQGERLPSELFSRCQDDGGDICFASDLAGTTQLPCEIVSVDKTNSQAEIWVYVSLTAGTSKTIYLFFGSSSILNQPPVTGTYGQYAVWANEKFVYHGNGTNSELYDSTSNVHDALPYTGTPTLGATGKIGKALSLDGSTLLSVPCTTDANQTGDNTIEGWMYFGGTGSNQYDLLFLAQTSSMAYAARDKNNSNIIRVNLHNSTTGLINSTSTWSNGTWVHITLTRVSNVQYLYLNGVLIGSASNTNSITNSATEVIGGNSDGHRLIGLIDELRVRQTGQSANYVATNYAIQTSTTLVTVGATVSKSAMFRRGMVRRLGSRALTLLDDLSVSA